MCGVRAQVFRVILVSDLRDPVDLFYVVHQIHLLHPVLVLAAKEEARHGCEGLLLLGVQQPGGKAV